MSFMARCFLFVFALVLTQSFTQHLHAQWGFIESDAGYQVPVQENEIKVMTYNVENLFNAVSNEGKRDWTWLPINHPLKARCKEISNPFYREACQTIDWTDDHVTVKVYQFQKALAAQGALPDIIGLQEVESEDVVAFMARSIGYKYIFVEGPDNRGIDVAILYSERNLQLLHFDSIDVSSRLGRATRDILRAHFQVRGYEAADVLTVLVNHWPSQGGPTSNRIVAAQVAQEAIEAGTQYVGEENYHVISLGDYNVLPLEQPHPVRDFLQNPQWKHALIDAHQLSDQSKNPMNGIMPIGSYYWERDDNWNRFDKILVSKNLRNGRRIEVVPESFRVVAPSFMTRQAQTGEMQAPLRYNFKTLDHNAAGFSDHFPVIVNIKLW